MTPEEKLQALAALVIDYALDEDEPFECMDHTMIEDAARIIFDGERAGFAADHADPEAFAVAVAAGLATNPKVQLEDGHAAGIGDRVFNYYDRVPVTITEIGSDGWCSTRTDDEPRGPLLNGARMCSLATARAKGWL